LQLTLSRLQPLSINIGKKDKNKKYELHKKKWKYQSRKTVITKKLMVEVKDFKENKKLSVTKIAKLTGRG